MIETLGEKCIMNKLQKTITVALTAFALTETSQVPFAAAVDVNSEKVTSSQKASRDDLVDPTTLVVSYTVKTSEGIERSSKQSIKVPRPDLSTPLSYFKDYLPEVIKEKDKIIFKKEVIEFMGEHKKTFSEDR